MKLESQREATPRLEQQRMAAETDNESRLVADQGGWLPLNRDTVIRYRPSNLTFNISYPKGVLIRSNGTYMETTPLMGKLDLLCSGLAPDASVVGSGAFGSRRTRESNARHTSMLSTFVQLLVHTAGVSLF